MRSRSCKALALAALLFGGAARADPPADAPIAIHKGDVAPVDGVLLSTQRAAEVAAKCQSAESERDALRLQLQDQPGIQPKIIIAAAVVGAALGLLAGLAVGALRK